MEGVKNQLADWAVWIAGRRGCSGAWVNFEHSVVKSVEGRALDIDELRGSHVFEEALNVELNVLFDIFSDVRTALVR